MHTGVGQAREVCLYVSRIAIFDKQHNRFLGNVVGVRPLNVHRHDKTWTFNPKVRQCWEKPKGSGDA